MYLRYKSFDLFLERDLFPHGFMFLRYPVDGGFVYLLGGKWRLTTSRC